MTAPRIGVVLVTHNSSRWIAATLESIRVQTVQPTRVLVVDDHSVDGTQRILDEWAARMRNADIAIKVVPSTCTDSHPWTRIARNFTQGVLAMQDLDLVALGDHDDEWMPNRLEGQSRLMRHGNSLFLASNGVIDGTVRTLFEAFEIPPYFGEWDARHKLRHVLRRSVATGGASMLRPGVLSSSPNFVPPRGWLHDRWWSIVAAAHEGLQVSDEPVIHYRILEDQSVGLNRGRQAIQGLQRLGSLTGFDVKRLTALHSLRSEAAPELRMEFSWGRLLKTLV